MLFSPKATNINAYLTYNKVKCSVFYIYPYFFAGVCMPIAFAGGAAVASILTGAKIGLFFLNSKFLCFNWPLFQQQFVGFSENVPLSHRPIKHFPMLAAIRQ